MTRATAIGRFRAQMVTTPNAPAVQDATQTWSYRELHAAAVSIAVRLEDAGDVVGVALPRDRYAVAAILGVMYAGAAYLPLDPRYPPARLQAMCSNAGARSVLAPHALHDARFPVAIAIDPRDIGDGGTPVSESAEPLPDATAYVMYTSGSTGEPKGVRVSHDNLDCLLDWLVADFSPREFALTAATTAFTFDPSLIEVFGPLVTGGTVRLLDGPLLTLTERAIPLTYMAGTPSVITEVLRAGRLPRSLRTLMVGGERLTPALAASLLEYVPGLRLLNAYGPTEATVMATMHEVVAPVADSIPIGRELPAVTIAIVDADGRPVADGEVGEIWIAGSHVSAGYVGDERVTALSFHVRDDGVRVYRTGDLGCRLPDGALEFRGRLDNQVKIRGFRVEPGEVEHAILAHPAVASAKVTAAGEGGRAHLVAYVVPADGAENFEPHALRGFLHGVLPDHLVPRRYVTLERLPLTTSGKVDSDALPQWRPETEREGDREVTEPAAGSDGLEDVVATHVRAVLGIEGPLRAADDFFDDLGGTSLALVEVLAALEQDVGRELPIGDVIADTTIRGFAQLARGSDNARRAVVQINPEGRKTPLFLVHAYLGSVLRYRALAPFLADDRPVIGVHVHDLDQEPSARLSIEDMAARAVEIIRGLHPAGPYLVGGHSIGGLIAYDVARRLVADGEDVERVLLLDAPALSSQYAHMRAEAVLNWPELRRAGWRTRRRQFRAIVESRRSLHTRVTTTNRVALTIERAGRISNLAVRRYGLTPYEGDVAIVRTRQGVRMAGGSPTLGWDRYVQGRIDQFDVEGEHNTMFVQPHVADVAARISEIVGDVPTPSRARSAELAPALAAYLGGRKRRPRVVLFGNYGNGNIGDEAILTGVLDACRPHADVTVVSRRPDRIVRDHGAASAPMGVAALRALAQCDIVAIGGGGIFGNDMKLLTEMLPTVGLAARRFGKETAFIAVGAYTSTPVWVQRRLRSLARRSAFVSARDEETAAVLGSLPLTVLVDDPAIALPPASAAEGLEALVGTGVTDPQRVLGVSMKATRFAERNEKQVEVIAAAIDWWHDEIGGDAVLLCLSERGDNDYGHTASDVTMAKDVRGRVRAPERVRQLGPDLTPALMKSAIGQMRAVIGHRLHAQIFAWSMGVPVAGVSYERKADAFLAQTGATRFDLWGLDGADLIAWLETITSSPASHQDFVRDVR
jgi:amino acid adenylation domain-containing protein